MNLAPEVAGAIVGGAIGIVSATVTAGVNYYTTKRRLRSKNQRRLAEFYIDKKVEALSKVHAHLNKCYIALGTALENPSRYSWKQVQSKIHSEIDALEHSITVGDIYLSSQQETELRETVEEYRSVADKIAILENGRQDMIDDVFGATERAGRTLAEEINKPIRRLERAGGKSDPGESDENAESKKVPPGHDDSGWAALAIQRDRIRNVFRITEDGTVEFLVEDVDPEARAFFTVLGRRYAYERDLVETPTVAEDELVAIFDGSHAAFDAFLNEAGEHLVSDDDEYYVEAEDIEEGIDWASDRVADGVIGRPKA